MNKSLGKIVSITEVFEQNSYPLTANEGSSFNGFVVETENRIVMMAINDDQECCEDSGYFMTNENINDFIGHELLDVKITDIDLEEHPVVSEKLNTILGECIVNDTDRTSMIMFVTLTTSNGILQFVAYNNHNGYYGHLAYVKIASPGSDGGIFFHKMNVVDL